MERAGLRFSERLGLIPVRGALQGRDLDLATRNRLWSCFVETVPTTTVQDLRRTWMYGLYQEVWSNHLKFPLDELSFDDRRIREVLKAKVLDGHWYEAYDLIEYVLNHDAHRNSAA